MHFLHFTLSVTVALPSKMARLPFDLMFRTKSSSSFSFSTCVTSNNIAASSCFSFLYWLWGENRRAEDIVSLRWVCFAPFDFSPHGSLDGGWSVNLYGPDWLSQQQQLYRLPWNLVQRFLVPRWWSLLTLVIQFLSLEGHQQIDIFWLLVKCLSNCWIYCH